MAYYTMVKSDNVAYHTVRQTTFYLNLLSWGKNGDVKNVTVHFEKPSKPPSDLSIPYLKKNVFHGMSPLKPVLCFSVDYVWPAVRRD